jgi:protein TonB
MRRLFIISAAIHVALFALLPVIPDLGGREPLAMEVYAVELVDLHTEPAPVEDVQEEVPEPEPAPVEPPPEADPIPEQPVKRPVRKVIAPPPKRVEKSLEEKIADRLKAQDERRPEPARREETPKPRTAPSSSTKISAGKVVADYYLTMLQGKITRNWKQPSARFTGGESPTARVSFTVLNSGSITNLRIVRSSNWSTIDQSAVQAVRDSAPFAELPSTYLGDRLDVTIDFTITQ